MKTPKKIRRSNIFLGCLFAVATFMLLSIGTILTGAWFTDSASSSPEGSYAEMHFGTVDVDLDGTGTHGETLEITVNENTCYQSGDIYYLVAGSSFTINNCGISIQNTSTVPIYYTLRHGANYYVIENGSLVAVEGADGLQSLANSVETFATNSDLPYLMPTDTTTSYVIANNWTCTLKNTANIGSTGDIWTINDGNIQFEAYSNVLPTGAITANGLIEVAKDILSGVFEVRAIQANNVGFATAKAELMPQVAVVDYDGGVQGLNAPLNGYNLEVVNGVVTLPSANPTKENYTFVGWEIDYAMNGADVVDGDAVVSNGTTTLTNQTSSATIRAKWERAVVVLTITDENNSNAQVAYSINANTLEAISNKIVLLGESANTNGSATIDASDLRDADGQSLSSSLKLDVGDTITLPNFTYDSRTYTNVQFKILGFNHDVLTSDSTQKAGITFQCTTALLYAAMNSNNSSQYGYAAMSMKNTTLPELKSAMPSFLTGKIKTVDKVYNRVSNGGAIRQNFGTNCDLWLLSATEIGVNDVDKYGIDSGSIYKYYAINNTDSDRVIAYHTNSGQNGEAYWLLRSAGDNKKFGSVNPSGDIEDVNVDQSNGVVPCFCI